MNAKGTLAVIGGGRMGEAIIGGLVAADVYAPGSITVAEPNAARRETLVAAHGVRAVADGCDALPADTLLLAVKPQIMDDVVAALASAVTPGTLVVSIAGGITCSRLESLLPAGCAVVRVMPNTPALVRQGMAVISGGHEATAQQVEAVRDMFAAIGQAIVLDERYQDAATAISGCGPAYVAIFVDALARAGVRQGLTREVAQALAVQTLRGTVELLEVTGQHPEQLVDGVASPGGATIAAVEQLEAGGFRSALSAAVDAAVKRSKELGS